MASLWQLSKTDSVLDLVTGTYIDHARNNIIGRLEEPYLLFVDADMVFSQANVVSLMTALAQDDEMGAVAAHYVKRAGNPVPVCNWQKDGEWLPDDERREWADKCRGVVEVGCFGMGLTLCRGAAINDLEYPYMESGYRDGGYMSEDADFCFKLRAAGWKVAVHFDVRVGHMGEKMWEPEAQEEERIIHAVS